MDEPRPPAPTEPLWHALGAEEVLGILESRPEGLSAEDARARLSRFGPNRLPEPPRKGPLARFFAQFHNLLIYVLLVAAVLSLLFEHPVDAAVILGVVVLNAIVGFVQEGKAEAALEAIKGMIHPKATVVREGRRRTIPAENVVPGDIVLVEAGDRVPADLRLVHAKNLRIDESILTGESVPVEKQVEPVAPEAALGDRPSMAFSGTLVVAGQGTGVVVATGTATELGKIGELLGRVERIETPLLRQMAGFARTLTAVILAVSAIAFLFGWLVQGFPVDLAFMAVVGLAVAAIPEGLPAVITITLAIGVQRMAQRNAIIRHLPAVETLGAVSVICSDKTGTLTKNEMTVQAIRTEGALVRVSGAGYAPEGSFAIAGNRIDPLADPVLEELLEAGLLCNDAEVRPSEKGWIVDGDPMEGALVTVALKAGLDPASLRRGLPRIDAIPFDSRHRYMATLHALPDGGRLVAVKGAPERILEMCRAERTARGERPLDRAFWERAAEELAAHGQRVLAIATAQAPRAGEPLAPRHLEGRCLLLGLVGLIDPPREEAIAAVAQCHTAGIRVVMITGDHAVTAREIARQLGIAREPVVLTGNELDALDAEAFRRAAREAHVFARTTPEHKLRLVEALQADGLIVAMTGDGVNDAPALKRADVGVAMGIKGTEAAKEAAQMVLADDNFASIVAAVREGRTVYDNLMKVIGWTLPTNGGEAGTILAALGLGLALPVTPVQILWINMVTAVALGLTLAFEPTEPGTMHRPPRRPEQPILSGELAWRIVFVSALFVLGAFGIFNWAKANGASIEEARTLVVNTIVVMEIFYLFSVRYAHGTSLTLEGLVGTRAVLIGVGSITLAQLAFTYLPWMQFLFETRPVGLLEGAVVIGIGVLLLCLCELEKRIRARLTGRARARPAAAETGASPRSFLG
ncbi:MAG: cation-transporting P-type ATPase [Geminicoccaceae bacterium]|nr:cation-transporting P-type ATPase [Geminicoccaceae bacterium]